MPYGNDENNALQKVTIDASGFLNGVLVENCSHMIIENLEITVDGKSLIANQDGNMRCGVLVTTSKPGDYGHITLNDLYIHDIFYENAGFTRKEDEFVSELLTMVFSTRYLPFLLSMT